MSAVEWQSKLDERFPQGCSLTIVDEGEIPDHPDNPAGLCPRPLVLGMKGERPVLWLLAETFPHEVVLWAVTEEEYEPGVVFTSSDDRKVWLTPLTTTDQEVLTRVAHTRVRWRAPHEDPQALGLTGIELESIT